MTAALFCRFALVEDALLLGWTWTDGFVGTHHGEWSVMLVWLCECEPVAPCRKRLEKESVEICNMPNCGACHAPSA